MWLNASTDYAIRMLICLSRASGVVSSSKLAKAIGVSPRYLLQIGARLREAGFVHVGHGSAGGYQLSRPPAKISLMDVIMAMNRKGNVAVLPDKRLPKEDFHTLECTYRRLEKGIHRQLESITISDLSQTECGELNRQIGKANT
ncbi:Rrf2 family nitric oxide-sensitive transcriptional repressor [Catenibacillus scindens]|uniref:Rrf2 family nitric oxide-sensitive transcriptional repressor n=1 Tax=Catenibacillus scindens TaxID=673271 RepID=A0A7W8H8I7_9FIRM|nr:Rrf2 family transcriptional regulator [Catenibacillus scindens]MBB5263717.1 Rrf2 family nitric oxide-sensitive transcriptional repressor [Catenibacillus scindens]